MQLPTAACHCSTIWTRLLMLLGIVGKPALEGSYPDNSDLTSNPQGHRARDMANESPASIALQSLPAEGEDSATAFSETLVPEPTLGAAPLCDRCSIFDIQSFARTPYRSRGYKRSDVERSAASNCRFCLLLLDSVEGLDPPDPFYISTFGALKSTKPELYIHMTLSENYETATEKAVGPFCFNRLHIAIGGRFDEVRSHSEVELCVAADRSELSDKGMQGWS